MTKVICTVCGNKVDKEDILKYIGHDKCSYCGSLDSFIPGHDRY